MPDFGRFPAGYFNSHLKIGYSSVLFPYNIFSPLDGDAEGNPEDIKKMKSRFGSNTRLGTQDNKSTKSPLARLTSNPSSTNVPSSNQMKSRRRSDSMSRKTLHKKGAFYIIAWLLYFFSD